MANANQLAALAVAVLVALLQLQASSCARHSPPVSAHTPAVMTLNGFERGESGGGAAACDGSFHSDGDKVVALSSGWLRLDGTRRCNKMIRITSRGGRSVAAKVVDECDSSRGCGDNIVDSSAAVWKALGLNTDAGRVQATKIVVLAAALALLQVSCAVARRHGKPPGPCDAAADLDGDDLLPGGLLHKRAPRPGSHHCTPAAGRGATPAVMTVNGFKRGESGGGPAACDGHFHSDGELIVALSTEWYAGGRRCHRNIRITSARHGRSVEAKVVDECDARRGCRHNIVDSSPAVWRALGLDTDVGEVSSCAAARRHGKPGLPSLHSGGDGTPAVMTVNGFKRGETGGGPAACDGHFHSDDELIVALSTRWFEHGQRCHRAIRIASSHDGRAVEARVVDECDSRRGCGDNIVDSSPAVWKALGLDTDVGEVHVTWSDA
ncbi:hypothetical protein U9M48_009567 [Paspalum notatum var. saurae]|uniref:Ripening-related protein 6 n=1 Tax=Paspalum notatum var. saurae TaxID=547442 RepID=A0AAQ3WF16_PASNO